MSISEVPVSTGFDQFELHQRLLDGVKSAGFETPRPIQAQAIPAALEGRDVMGLAQTGTGKTAAFGLPILQRLMGEHRPGPRALILAPTRELATQISDELRMLSRFTKVKGVTIFGGVPQGRQVQGLRRDPEIVIGCPGRVLDLMQQGILKLDNVETLVLDEADHMFDMGFLPGIRRILGALPPVRQNLLFSATMPREVRHLANEVLNKPHVVELAGSAPASTIDHALILVGEKSKRDLLEHVLKNDDCTSAIVFTRTKHRAKRLAAQLCDAGYNAVGLQGNLSQAARDRAMHGFRNRRFNVLVATDIVARGIDVSGISHVINFDVPNTPEAYTHRIGRTGRAELEGTACTFVTASDHAWVRATERMIGSPIARRQIEGFGPDPSEKAESPEPRRGGRSFKSGGGSRPGARRPARTNGEGYKGGSTRSEGYKGGAAGRTEGYRGGSAGRSEGYKNGSAGRSEGYKGGSTRTEGHKGESSSRSEGYRGDRSGGYKGGAAGKTEARRPSYRAADVGAGNGTESSDRPGPAHRKPRNARPSGPRRTSRAGSSGPSRGRRQSS